MYKKTLQSVREKEYNSVIDRKPHVIFSAENPLYPQNIKYNLDSQGVQDLLAKKGYRFDVIQGHYGKPEQSILVHNPSKKSARFLQGLAAGLGQESSIYSDGYNHELHFHGGENAGKHIKGQGTTFHKRPPEDFYSVLKDGTHFTHVFGDNMHEEHESMLKPNSYIKKSEDDLKKMGMLGNWKKEGYKLITQKNTYIHGKTGTPYHKFTVHAETPDGYYAGQYDFYDWNGINNRHLVVDNAVTDPEHRRKGLASAAYQVAQNHFKKQIQPIDHEQSADAKALWNNPNRQFGKSESPEDELTLIHYSPTQGLKAINPAHQGTRIKDSSSKYGRPEHPMSFFYRPGSTTEDLVTQGSQSKYHVKVNHSKLYDIGTDKDNVYQELKQSGKTMNPGIVTRDDLHGELKRRGYHGFYNSQHEREDMRGVVGLYHETPVAGEESLNKSEEMPSSTPQASDKGSDKIRQVADQYAKAKGMTLQHNMPPVKVDEHRAKRIADAFHQAQHEPHMPHVQQSYNALINETNEQFKHMLKTGLKISKIQPGQENPYKNSKDLFHDIHNNNHIWYYPTDQGFGSDPTQQNQQHPMLQSTEHVDNEGKPMLANDVFRIVHDYFGHAKEGHGFGAHGEENAWKNHMQMYSPQAQKALTAETRGQNSWVNYGPHGEHNRANPGQTKYADQKATILPDWAMDSDHHSVYKQLGKSELSGKHQKRLDIMKGAMARLAPYNPDKHISPEDHKATENWTMEGDDQDARQNVPEMHSNAKIRALHKLGSKTQVRRHPKTGERMFLLHRGMAESEFQTNHINGIANYAPNSFTSWTPHYKVAQGFSTDHQEEGTKPRVVSAWIPESHIHNVPNATVIPDENTQFRTEHEVIVSHKGKFPHAHPKIVEVAKDPRKDLNQKINIKGQAAEARNAPEDEWLNDHKKMVQRQERAEAYKKSKFGKREAILTPTLKKGDISNKIKAGIAGVALAAGTLTPIDMSNKQSQVPPQVVEAPKPMTTKDRILNAISAVESSGGKNTNHAKLSEDSIHQGERAFGKFGLTPLVVRETIKKNPDLSAHSPALKLMGDEFHSYMKKHPDLENIVASKHYDRLAKKFGENVDKIAYSWLNGITGTNLALKSGKKLHEHWHVKKVRKAYGNLPNNKSNK